MPSDPIVSQMGIRESVAEVVRTEEGFVDVNRALKGMSDARKSNKDLRRRLIIGGVLLILLVGAIAGVSFAVAILTRHVVLDPSTGFAMSGDGSIIMKTAPALKTRNDVMIHDLSTIGLSPMDSIFFGDEISFDVKGHTRKRTETILLVKGGGGNFFWFWRAKKCDGWQCFSHDVWWWCQRWLQIAGLDDAFVVGRMLQPIMRGGWWCRWKCRQCRWWWCGGHKCQLPCDIWLCTGKSSNWCLLLNEKGIVCHFSQQWLHSLKSHFHLQRWWSRHRLSFSRQHPWESSCECIEWLQWSSSQPQCLLNLHGEVFALGPHSVEFFFDEAPESPHGEQFFPLAFDEDKCNLSRMIAHLGNLQACPTAVCGPSEFLALVMNLLLIICFSPLAGPAWSVHSHYHCICCQLHACPWKEQLQPYLSNCNTPNLQQQCQPFPLERPSFETRERRSLWALAVRAWAAAGMEVRMIVGNFAMAAREKWLSIWQKLFMNSAQMELTLIVNISMKTTSMGHHSTRVTKPTCSWEMLLLVHTALFQSVQKSPMLQWILIWHPVQLTSNCSRTSPMLWISSCPNITTESLAPSWMTLMELESEVPLRCITTTLLLTSSLIEILLKWCLAFASVTVLQQIAMPTLTKLPKSWLIWQQVTAATEELSFGWQSTTAMANGVVLWIRPLPAWPHVPQTDRFCVIHGWSCSLGEQRCK